SQPVLRQAGKLRRQRREVLLGGQHPGPVLLFRDDEQASAQLAQFVHAGIGDVRSGIVLRQRGLGGGGFMQPRPNRGAGGESGGVAGGGGAEEAALLFGGFAQRTVMGQGVRLVGIGQGSDAVAQGIGGAVRRQRRGRRPEAADAFLLMSHAGFADGEVLEDE